MRKNHPFRYLCIALCIMLMSASMPVFATEPTPSPTPLAISKPVSITVATPTPTPTSTPTPTPEPTKTETDDSAGNYIVAKEDAVMRTVPDSRDPMTAFDMIEAGDKLPILEKGVKSEDPEFKEWVKVEWNGYELYMKREDVDFVEE